MKKIGGAAAAPSKKGLLRWRLSGHIHGVTRCPFLTSEINSLLPVAVVELENAAEIFHHREP
jgi:hypothetical protein